MTDKDLQAILQAGEGYHVEFKQAVDKSFVEEACAFANSGGGAIFLGVADDGTIKGIDTGNVSRSRIQDTLGQLEPSLSLSEKHTMLIVSTLSRTLSRTLSEFGPRIHENQTRCETRCETRLARILRQTLFGRLLA